MKDEEDIWMKLCSKHNCLLVDTFDAIHYGQISNEEYVKNLIERFQSLNLAYIELYEQHQSTNQDNR